MFGALATGVFATTAIKAGSGPHRRQPEPGRDPARRRRRHDRLRGRRRRSSSSRSSTSSSASGSRPKHEELGLDIADPRRSRVPELIPDQRSDGRAPRSRGHRLGVDRADPHRTEPCRSPRSAADASSIGGSRARTRCHEPPQRLADDPVRRSTTPPSSTTRAASGSSPMPVDGPPGGCSRSRWPASRPSVTVAPSRRTVQSSDGAGVLLPLAPSIRLLLGPTRRRRRRVRGDGEPSCRGPIADGSQAARRSWRRRSGSQAWRSRAGAPSRRTPAPWAPRRVPRGRRSSRHVIARPAGWTPGPVRAALVCARRRAQGWRGPGASMASRSRRRRRGRSSTRASSRGLASARSSRTSSSRWTCRSRCSTSGTPPTPHPRGRSPSRSASSPTTARSTPSAATAKPSAADATTPVVAGAPRRRSSAARRRSAA